MKMLHAWLRALYRICEPIRVFTLAAGVALGAATALVGLLYLAVAALAYAVLGFVPRVRQRITGVARRLAEYDRRRVERFLGGAPAGVVTDARAVGYLAVRVPLGALGGTVLLLLLYGALTGFAVVVGWIVGRPVDDIEATPFIVVYFAILGVVLLFLAVQGIVGVAALDRRLTRALLGPTEKAHYEQRIAVLSAARAEIVAAVDAERRRIERDLHDGVQQRLVALGMLLGRARRATDPVKADDLLRQAHEESAGVLAELREVAWRVYPSALDDGGLPAALEIVAERSPVPVRVALDVPVRPDPAVETVAYFVVCEAVTNAAKHSRASRVEVGVACLGDVVHVRIQDDGVGGADPTGGGLAGLHRRVTALDGQLHVHSPVGGPTTITAELPCA
ncbi:sensor histidine kinase [Micromonospora sonneratiae]|uniref:histidine kinase n=1 Tax=Micromonospora sonneratiae TaxID=1184706 RepID=A0ABW3YAK5_9ACTN